MLPRVPRVLRSAVRRAARRRDGPPQAFPPGTYYSPVVDPSVVVDEPDRSRIWPDEPADPPGVEWRDRAQVALLRTLARYPLPAGHDGEGPAYRPDNGQFPPQDAALLYGLLRHLRPRRVVEVGAGWSTTITARAIRDGGLDTELTCVDPHPPAYVSDVGEITQLRTERVERTPVELFTRLGEGDVLFIDSSHVAKTGSDVVHLLLHVVPRLAAGVHIHVHDVFLPEDYPMGWVAAGFGWNEQYLLQALLVGNRDLEVTALNHWLSVRHPAEVERALGPVPLTGSSAWLRVRTDGS